MVLSPEQRSTLSNAADKFVNDVKDRGYDSIIFLDKSARPYATLFKSRWKKTFPDEKMPEIRFADVGREKTVYVPDDGLQSLVEKARKKFRLAGKDVLIFDDYYSTGKTMSTAMYIFSEAFPTSNFYSGTMGGRVSNRSKTPYGMVDIGPYLHDEAPYKLPENVFEDSEEGITISKYDSRNKLKGLREELVSLLQPKRGLIERLGDALRVPFSKRSAFIEIGKDKESWKARYTKGDDQSWSYPEMDKSEITDHPHTYKEAIDEGISKIDEELATYGVYPKIRKEMKEIGREKPKMVLEKILGFLAIVLLSVSLIITYSSITGHAIGFSQNNDFIGVGLFILGVSLAFWRSQFKELPKK